MRYTVREEDGGKTVKTLIGELLHPSTRMLKTLKYREDGIRLCGARVTVRAAVHPGAAQGGTGTGRSAGCDSVRGRGPGGSLQARKHADAPVA